eukprot:TRINITY_DN2328_c0_g1_i1.p1 TRINITY_DN2328_c0_g1~~TRINITY_DN2328_c0_g1_i1.p1  ORF type:complete len:623 (+),score=165.16 TRINITY_DN2328_c0_g1_i1:65-1870(+)
MPLEVCVRGPADAVTLEVGELDDVAALKGLLVPEFGIPTADQCLQDDATVAADSARLSVLWSQQQTRGAPGTIPGGPLVLELVPPPPEPLPPAPPPAPPEYQAGMYSPFRDRAAHPTSPPPALRSPDSPPAHTPHSPPPRLDALPLSPPASYVPSAAAPAAAVGGTGAFDGVCAELDDIASSLRRRLQSTNHYTPQRAEHSPATSPPPRSGSPVGAAANAHAAALAGLADGLRRGDASVPASRRESLVDALQKAVDAAPRADPPAARTQSSTASTPAPAPCGRTQSAVSGATPARSDSRPLGREATQGSRAATGVGRVPSTSSRPPATAAAASPVPPPGFARTEPPLSPVAVLPLTTTADDDRAHLRLCKGPGGALRLEVTGPGAFDELAAPAPPPLMTGQQVTAAVDLFIPGESGGAEVAVVAGSAGVVQGPAPPGPDTEGRTAVLFSDGPPFAINVKPEEVVENRAEPFDVGSRTLETQLARLLWDGRDRLAAPPPQDTKGQALRRVNPFYRRRLMRFYERYNPHRLPCVAQQLRDYAGREDAMFAALVRKYGPEPEDVREVLPPGWTQVQSSKGDVFYRHVNGGRQWQRPRYRAFGME